ncbi:hypothetical protein D088_600045 [Salmonella enterica subsp. houtenae serovar 16:z4,z32:-- str. RKS3027]|nr:hypothetical protein D088_600045 [Salmonella enterica subsp. houtenae serovar 16:z4,z32:-- str. RKS3027]
MRHAQAEEASSIPPVQHPYRLMLFVREYLCRTAFAWCGEYRAQLRRRRAFR